MLNRKFLKNRANEALQNKYGTAILVILVYLLITNGLPYFTRFFLNLFGSVSSGVFSINLSTSLESLWQIGRISRVEYTDAIASFFKALLSLGPFLLVGSLLLWLAGIIFKLLVVDPLTVGMKCWFVRNSEKPLVTNFNYLFSPFSGGNYLGIVKITLWRSLWLFIWSLPTLVFGSVLMYLNKEHIAELINYLGDYMQKFPNGSYHLQIELDTSTVLLTLLFLIVAIANAILVLVKRYSYRMADYIAADAPQMPARKTLRLSRAMTSGYKMDMFFFDLSFAGWFILLSFCCCAFPYAFWLIIGPRYQGSWAELYKDLRQQAVQKGYTTMQELGYILR
ncbi:MAG TPA: DUF975 family protein [Clostridiaceae bacterium]|nr:DUF975 family protein [Clostridiaceae bacterium]